MLKNKGFSTIVLVIILAVLVGGGYAVWQKQLGSEASKSGITADWKTYRNDEYGFEFKYPINLTFRESLPSGTNGTVMFSNPNDGMVEFNATVFLNTEQLSKGLDSWVDQGEVLIDGQKARKMIAENENSTNILYLIASKNTSISFSQNNFGEQILSTFKFIDQTTDTSNWKTYRNDKYGFEFKYPVERTAFTFDADNKISNVDRNKLIPAPSDSDVVHIAMDAQNESLALCCEAELLTFDVRATTTPTRKWIEKYIDIPEWQSGQIIVRDVTFAGKPAIEVNGQYNGNNGPGHVIAVRLDESSILVIKNDVDSSPFPEILSTFRFIK